MNSDERLEVLKEILLTDDREFVDKITRKIEALEKEQASLPERVHPVLDVRLKTFIDEIPQKLGPTITEALRTEIKKSQDAVAEALYPVMGLMIKKYVQNEIEKLNESINAGLSNAFSFKNIFKSKKARAKDVAQAMYNTREAKIEHILVIEKDSGLLKASYSKSQILDQDMVAGMLTAIKAFVEDAFLDNSDTSLQQIKYDLHTIHLQNFSSYYIAAVLSGIYDTRTRDRFEEVLFKFAQHIITQDDLQDQELFNRKLKAYIEDENV